MALLHSALLLTASPQSAKLTLYPDEPTKEISPNLVGAFFEDLNYAADGGLYAELIQNRSFEYSPTEQSDWGAFSFWELLDSDESQGYLGLGDARPVHVNNPHYLLLNSTQPGIGAGVMNSGFDGIPVEAGKQYRASFWAYQTFMGQKWGGPRVDQRQAMPVVIRLEDPSGTVIAEASVAVQGREWCQYGVILTAEQSVEDARFVLLTKEQGGLAIDMVSLYPLDTFMGRSNGLRKDLAQAIADFKPKFIRFPGGCLVHGPGIRHYYDWKRTVGPVEARGAARNSWGYHQTFGLGYFEYFQYCEDIGAMPLPVVSAGVCCQHAGDSPGRGQEGLPLDEMPQYIQDILDLIEWANGSPESKWGSVRAAAGHPEPFGLQYIGVGNEDAITPIFRERFRMIHEVLSEQHPEITVIGTVGPFAQGEDYDNGWEFARELDLGLVDEHYYVSPQWFWDHADRYDHYDRSKASVYVGEYAAHDTGKRNTLRSALAEAAGLIGFENNADIVQFASYAPLLARINHTQWTPDLIYFNQNEVLLTANYYVQQLFGNHHGDALLQTELKKPNEAARFLVSAMKDTETGEFILKMVNGESESLSLNVKLETDHDFRETVCQEIVLTGSSLDAVNELGQPPVVAPEVSQILISNEMTYEIPAHALVIWRWKSDAS